MASAIDPSLPVTGEPTTQSVRDNFAAAASEINDLLGANDDLTGLIDALQAQVNTLQSQMSALTGRVVVLENRATPALYTMITPDPKVTSSTNYVMMGLGVVFTPTGCTRVVVTIDGSIGNSTNVQSTSGQLVWGTGTPPANGAPMTGTPLGTPIVDIAARTGDYDPFSESAIVVLDTAGQTVWFDMAVKVTGGASILMGVEVTAFGLTDAVPAPTQQA